MIDKMVDCPKCAIRYRTNQNKSGVKGGRPLGYLQIYYVGWRGEKVYLLDVCDMCGASGRVVLSRAYPSSARMKKELMKIYKKQKYELKDWVELEKNLLGVGI